MVLSYETVERCKEVRQFLRDRLVEFDLRDDEIKQLSLTRLGLCVVLAVPTALAALATALLHNVYLAPGGSRPGIGVFWVLFPLIGVAVYLAAKEGRRSWRQRQIKEGG
jgi:hypothetical protein